MFGQKKTLIGATIQFAPFLGALVFVPLVAFTGSLVGSLGVVLGFIGLGFITNAKMPALQSGDLFSFGSKAMPQNLRLRYRIGYGLLTVGILMGIAVIILRTQGILV